MAGKNKKDAYVKKKRNGSNAHTANRKYKDTAVKRAVEECIQEGILAEFLRKNKSEVIAMSIFEYDKEEEERKLRKAEYEAGYDDGEKAGYNLGQKKEKANIIQIMLAAGENPEKIARYTGCSVEEVKEFSKNKAI